jgi:hypothetical protein
MSKILTVTFDGSVLPCKFHIHTLKTPLLLVAHWLYVNTLGLSISFLSLRRASCYKSGNPPNALASLRLGGSLKN